MQIFESAIAAGFAAGITHDLKKRGGGCRRQEVKGRGGGYRRQEVKERRRL